MLAESPQYDPISRIGAALGNCFIAVSIKCRFPLTSIPALAKHSQHLRRYNRCYASQMTRRLRVINYLNAFGALAAGYKHFHLLEDWRMRATRSLRRMLGPSVPST